MKVLLASFLDNLGVVELYTSTLLLLLSSNRDEPGTTARVIRLRAERSLLLAKALK